MRVDPSPCCPQSASWICEGPRFKVRFNAARASCLGDAPSVPVDRQGQSQDVLHKLPLDDVKQSRSKLLVVGQYGDAEVVVREPSDLSLETDIAAAVLDDLAESEMKDVQLVA